MRHIAIIGAGPAGFYTAESCLKAFDGAVRIDILDRLPVPFGLIRTGVAPDHQSIKAVSRRYEKVALDPAVRFIGNVLVGRDVTIAELQGLYDAVVLSTGAPHDRRLAIPGGDLPGVIGSAAFVGWYNGHPDFADLDPPLGGEGAVIIGNGNVALDVARILAKTEDEFAGSDIVDHALSALRTAKTRRITVLGRRGPHQIAMTPKELGELGHLARATPLVDPADLPDEAADDTLEPGQRKSVGHLRSFAASSADPVRPVVIDFDFFAMPIAVEGDGRVERVIVERTRIDERQRAVGTGETYAIPASLVVSCIGYATPAIDGVPYDADGQRFANDAGRIAAGLYCAGWARRGPSGTIGTNKPDGEQVAVMIGEDTPPASGKAGGAGLDALLDARGVGAVSYSDWQRIEAAENARARPGSPREKFVAVAEMLAVVRR